MHSMSLNVTSCAVLHSGFFRGSRVSSCIESGEIHCFASVELRDNKKLKQGHFEMGIRYANFMPISNHFARTRACCAMPLN